MQRTKTILISGGGIAGPALAYWLREYGFTPVVVERAPRIRTGGQRIEMSGVGAEALHRMGLLERIRAESGPPPAGVFYLGRADRPAAMPSWDSPADDRPERAPFAVKRGVLGTVLYENAREGVEYVFDDSITAVEQSDDGVRVSFENSAPRRVDLVVGADGLFSNVRSLVFGPAERFTRFLGTNLVIFTVDNYLGHRDSMSWHMWPYRGCAITTFPGNAELEGLFLFRSTRPMEVRDLTVEQRMRLVERIYADAGWEVPGLLRQMRASRDFVFTPSTQIRMDSWTRGRVALVGDSGYCPDPMSGQGSTLALVGAYILAAELRAAGGDHTRALPAYDAAMRRFVAFSQGVGDYSTAFAAPRAGRWGTWAREQQIRALFAVIERARGLNLPVPAAWLGGELSLADYAPAA
ncbi:FAD-dependent monooxygenase [Streptomonospora nanhaiensis]|uniref:2-polyprenyl-6-methoxyphenol hydroxylase-like FAD-dependent oxidoreductase n=1 Tax=Streptomonospora nanhaiensis TaxID=1323731 RepID=A0A853BP43_9ACTN|nr:FAD-dependent monooxygenase [Streptomonospora nanhaiensis]MBV2365763.1 FAD-dependent monooxygenase [Streptomonospora nanhaiensis]MBX9388090.1 FAD-dependent monooxygenase [Streptomonospora nanhaiensis]NYI96485.1 2-polyprenyl-6-methoxyphenol hydroxylase-like FAD-dependent oxidoreductase [Streptomonospora nanhaiensis]